MHTRRWISGVVAVGAVGATLAAISTHLDRGQITTVLAHHSSSSEQRSARRPTVRPITQGHDRGMWRHPTRPTTPPSPTAGAPTVAPPGQVPTSSATPSVLPSAAVPSGSAPGGSPSDSPAPTSPAAPAAPATGGACAPAPGSPAVVDVTSKGAKPGDSGDDTATIQVALDAVPSGGTVVVPDGVYMINATRGVRPKSSTTLRLSSGSVLRAIATSSGNYNLIRIQDVSNVAVVGGTVEGDLGRHQGTDGQWGHGISIVDARSVTIDSVAAVQAWGDGFYVGGTTSANITLCRVRADHNRRQGISVTDVDGMVIRNSAFTRTLGEPGGAGSGIDLEPNGNQHVHNVQLLNNTITDNSVQGLSIGMNNAFVSTSTNKNITVRGNTFDNNGLSASASIMRTGVYVSDATNVLIESNVVRRSHGAGIYVTSGSRQVTVRGNTVTGTTKAGRHGESGAGIAMYEDVGTVVTGNTVTGNAGQPIFRYDSGSTVSGNTTS